MTLRDSFRNLTRTPRRQWLLVGAVLILAAGVAFAVRDDSGELRRDPDVVAAANAARETTSGGTIPGGAPRAAAADAGSCTEGCIGGDIGAAARDAVLRVSIGGAAYRDRAGNDWVAGRCEGGETYVSPNPIAGTDDDPLYQARQFEPRCRFPLEPGRYELVFGWAETYRADPGYRVFALNVEGRAVGNIDIGRAAGLNAAYVRTVVTDVVDGELTVAATKVENRPMLAALAVKRLGDATGEGTTGGGSSGTAAPATIDPAAPPTTLTVGPGQAYSTLQAALDVARPGDTVQLATPGDHEGPARSKRDGADGRPITVTAVDGAQLRCPSPASGEVARCFELNHSWFVFDHFAIQGGSSNLYMTGDAPGSSVHDVVVRNSTFRGAPDGGTGECIRIKYHAARVEIASNDIADCGLGKCCTSSKNGEAVYIGTAPEQLEDKNPSPEPDTTTGVWVHHNVMRPWNECVDIKEGAFGNLVEHNTCSGQRDVNSGAFGSRGGTVGKGNTFRFNLVLGATGACVRFGGDEAPQGTGNDFYGNVCRDIAGEHSVNQQAEPQGLVCGNRFEGAVKPRKRISRTENVDPASPCPAGVDMAGAASPGAS